MRNSNNNQINISQARETGDQMVKHLYPVRIVNYVRNNRTSAGHTQKAEYMASIII